MFTASCFLQTFLSIQSAANLEFQSRMEFQLKKIVQVSPWNLSLILWIIFELTKFDFLLLAYILSKIGLGGIGGLFGEGVHPPLHVLT